MAETAYISTGIYRGTSVSADTGGVMRKVKVAAVQMSCTSQVKDLDVLLKDNGAIDEIKKRNIDCGDRLVRKAAGEGANIILLPELFELP